MTTQSHTHNNLINAQKSLNSQEHCYTIYTYVLYNMCSFASVFVVHKLRTQRNTKSTVNIFDCIINVLFSHSKPHHTSSTTTFRSSSSSTYLIVCWVTFFGWSDVELNQYDFNEMRRRRVIGIQYYVNREMQVWSTNNTSSLLNFFPHRIYV